MTPILFRFFETTSFSGEVDHDNDVSHNIPLAPFSLVSSSWKVPVAKLKENIGNLHLGKFRQFQAQFGSKRNHIG